MESQSAFANSWEALSGPLDRTSMVATQVCQQCKSLSWVAPTLARSPAGLGPLQDEPQADPFLRGRLCLIQKKTHTFAFSSTTLHSISCSKTFCLKSCQGWVISGSYVILSPRAVVPKFCCTVESPMNSMRRQNDRILKEELPRLEAAQYATGDQWRNNYRKNEGKEPKQL